MRSTIRHYGFNSRNSMLLSPQFTFLIGSNRTEFIVPACFISSLSPSLDALMNNGSMRESVDRSVVFENLTPNMFAAVCEYAYTGSYRVPPPADDDESEIPGEECVMPAEILSSQGLGIKQEDLQREVKQHVKEDSLDLAFLSASKAPKKHRIFQEVSLEATTTRRLQQSFAMLQYNIQSHEESQSRDLMFHARLYAFAEEQLIEALQTRCLAYIHRELQDLAAEGDTCDEFVQLLWFAYTSASRHGQSGEDRLRRLVIHYAACNLETLVQQSKFMAVLDRYGECGCDLIRRLYT